MKIKNCSNNNSQLIWKKIIQKEATINCAVAIDDNFLYSCDLDEYDNIKSSTIGKVIEVSFDYEKVLCETLDVESLDYLDINIKDEIVNIEL